MLERQEGKTDGHRIGIISYLLNRAVFVSGYFRLSMVLL
jgi:hypothetical protein